MTRLVFTIFAIITIFSSTCFANLPLKEFAIGGIVPGSSINYVKSIYGEPDRIDSSDRHLFLVYGNTFYISFNSSTKIIFSVESRGNNGIKTPSGLTVKDSIKKVKSVYGKPFSESDMSLEYRSDVFIENGEKRYYMLNFSIENGKIRMMSLHKI